jgi:hypothetical protein
VGAVAAGWRLLARSSTAFWKAAFCPRNSHVDLPGDESVCFVLCRLDELRIVFIGAINPFGRCFSILPVQDVPLDES